MEDLINNVRMLYDYNGPEERAVSPPLPSPPSQEEEDSPVVGALNSRNNVPVYGSSHTVIKTVPAQGTNPASTTSEIAPKLPPRPNRQPRRATISTGSATDPSSSNVPNPSGPSSSRPSEDGRATGYSRPPPSPGSTAAAGTSKQQPRLELKTRSANTSSTSSPVKERENRTGAAAAAAGTATSYSAPSSKNTSDVALMPPQAAAASGSGGDSALSLSTTLNTSTTKRPSYSDSLLREPAVLMSQGILNDNPGEPEEVDYPGSPDTSALEFRTAVNTPETEEQPYPFGF
jgi:hypothetical protein